MRGENCIFNQFSSIDAFLNFVELENHQIDCLVLENQSGLINVLNQLECRGALLPTLVLDTPASPDEQTSSSEVTEGASDEINRSTREALYHTAILHVDTTQLHQIGLFINQVINKFLELSPACPLPKQSLNPPSSDSNQVQAQLISHQQRLAQKLRERLGYLGVYYRRNPQNFLRNMQPSEKQEFLEQLKTAYREIILNYFSEDDALNQMIDHYVTMAFFADIPIARVVEIHMELMDEFSKQLKIEGRSEEILLDYRLTLIDTLANLCEMYRRSIPRDSE